MKASVTSFSFAQVFSGMKRVGNDIWATLIRGDFEAQAEKVQRVPYLVYTKKLLEKLRPKAVRKQTKGLLIID